MTKKIKYWLRLFFIGSQAELEVHFSPETLYRLRLIKAVVLLLAGFGSHVLWVYIKNLI